MRTINLHQKGAPFYLRLERSRWRDGPSRAMSLRHALQVELLTAIFGFL